jgi:N-dimethylarginine dimethylaminohydrolase
MCCPDHFDVTYEINPWMNRAIAPSKKNAWKQWKELHHTLIRLGVWVEYVEPVKGQPDMVFTANAGLVKDKKCILSHFKYKERSGEEVPYRKWFEDHGYTVIELKNCFFEGEGDALFAGEKLFIGTGFRSDPQAAELISKALNLTNVYSCELINPHFYHLDTCFCPLNDKQAFFYPGAFSEKSIKLMKEQLELFEIAEADAKKFACNANILGKDVVLPAGCESTCALLKKLGYNPYPVQLDEFIKAGGAAKCLTLRV